MIVRTNVFIAACAVAGSILIGCGGDDEDGAADTDASQEVETPLSTAPTSGTAAPSTQETIAPTTPPTSTSSATEPPTTATDPPVATEPSTPATDEDTGGCPLISAEDASAIVSAELTLPPGSALDDPGGRGGASCSFINADGSVLVTIVRVAEGFPGAIDADVQDMTDNDISYQEIDDLGTRAVASGGAGSVSLSVESEDAYLLVTINSPGAPGADPFTPAPEVLEQAVALARAVAVH